MNPFFTRPNGHSPIGSILHTGLVLLLAASAKERRKAPEVRTMTADEIIAEACRLPLPDLERVATILGFEVQDRLMEQN